MKPTRTSVFFDLSNGTLEIRCTHETCNVTGYWKAFDGGYHNTALLVVNEQFQHNQIRELLRHVLGKFTLFDEGVVKVAIVGLPGVRAL